MKGKIYRVTYNAVKEEATIHMSDGDVVYLPMTNEEWETNLKGNLIDNFNKLLDE
jgi:hypothetical protein